MNIAHHLLLFPVLLVFGCETVDRARRAQASEERWPGETSVTAAQAGLSAAHPFTLAELERVALEHHPALLSARQAVEAARLQLRMTHAGRLPQLNASAAYTRNTQNAWGRSTASEARGSWSAGVGLDLLLYDSGRLDAAERQNVEALVAAEQSLRDSELETVHAVRAAFFERHRSVHLMNVAVESESQYAQHLEEARIMTEVGTRRQYDVTKAEVDWGNARLEVVTASNNLVVAHAQLNRALGLAENPDYRIGPGELPAARRHPDALLADARFNAPSLAVLRARERAAERLAEQVFDFVICTRESSAIACAVNLAARSRLSRRPPKNRLDRICAAAKLPFVRFRESDVYSVVEIEEQVFSAMQTLRIHPRAEELSAQDTRDALRDLSDVIGEKVPERTRTKRSALPTLSTHSTEQAAPSAPVPIKPGTRTEPRLHLDDDLDISPESRMPEPRIEVEFDEDRPRRARI